MKEALGVIETRGLVPGMAALDAMEKAAAVRVFQAELNDFCGIVLKIVGPVEAVRAAVAAGIRVAEQLHGRPVSTVVPRVDEAAWQAIQTGREYNRLIEQDVVLFPRYEVLNTSSQEKDLSVMTNGSFALGFIETQGFTAVFEAIDTACKAANVEVVGKEKLGGGYVTVVIQGDLSAVTAAIEAGKAKVEGLGSLIAAHVLARPSASVLALLPKAGG